jgi:peptide/nickel transport system ATP-binding protein
MSALLEIHDLSVGYATEHGVVAALRHAKFEVGEREVVGIVGESGSGKSTLIAAIAGLLADNARITSGSIAYKGADITRGARDLRGRDLAMVFQDPMTAFNPVFTIGEQLIDFQHRLAATSCAERRKRAAAMLARVGIPDPELRLDAYPHELSGGTRQRIAIAAALLVEPRLLIADEPTTALDVTMESQIIHLLRELRHDYDGSIVVVTHHLGVIAELCDRVYVMYAGQIVEHGLVDDIFHAPLHPYTRALLACDPAHYAEREEYLPTIAGELPNLAALPAGCVFAPRCDRAVPACRLPPPEVVAVRGHRALCLRARP